MQPVNTREQLLQALRIHGPQTAADLGQRLEIGVSAVRQHLARALAEGWVEVLGLRHGRGRPCHLYALTPKADQLFPQHYDGLVLDLLESLDRLPEGAEVLGHLLALRRQIWHERYASRLANRTLGERLAQITQIMNEQGGLAHYLAQPDGTYLLINHHCSIAAVVGRYPQFCLEEQGWIEEALQSPIEALQSRATGETTCLFRVLLPSPTRPGRRIRRGG